MTSRVTLFESPLFLGFDQFERAIERIRKTEGGGYPPYNIEQIGDDKLRITLAVAGFKLEDLDIELEHNQLTVRGRAKEDPQDASRTFLHRGIAARAFQRGFVLADGIEVMGADLDSGLLNIDLRRVMPEPQVQKIAITSTKKPSKENIKTGIIEIEGQA